jgi:hypothetical protein
MSTISGVSNSYLQSVLGAALNATGLSSKATSNRASNVSASQAGQPDQTQLSPFAQLMSSLQQLQQSDPAKYQQVTQQVATNLQGAAQTAQASGNTTAANQLNQLATDFTSASQTGQIPNMKDIAQAMGGHHHHHMHAPDKISPTDPSATGTTGTASTSVDQALSQFMTQMQSNITPNASLDPMSIISSTLASAGIGNN